MPTDGWEQWCAHYDAKPVNPLRPLSVDAIPLIRQVAITYLGPIVDEADGFRCYCPFGGHSRTTRVGRVVLNPQHTMQLGYFHCHGCGTHGHWNRVMEQLGLDPIQVFRDTDIAVTVPLPEIRLLQPYEPPRGMIPWPDRDWVRTNKDGTQTVIRAETMRAVGARIYRTAGTNDQGLTVPETRAWLPWPTAEYPQGHQAALLSARYDGCVKYRNSKGAWVREALLFSAIAERMGTDTVVLCEGPADALRLLDLGIPAVAILGANNWSQVKTDRVRAWQRVIVCLDADKAGAAGTVKIMQALTRAQVSATTLDLPDGHDPASMPRAGLIAAFGVHGVRPRQW